MTSLHPWPAIIRTARLLTLTVLLSAAAGCGKEDRPQRATNPAKAVATAEGQTQVVRPQTATATNRTAIP